MIEDRTKLDVGAGRAIWQDDPGYEETHRAAVWNARKPRRYPDVIVVAESDRDVVSAVNYARSRGLRIAVRAGGHSLSAPQLRDGGMLIDLSQMNGTSIDAKARTAVVQPGVTAA